MIRMLDADAGGRAVPGACGAPAAVAAGLPGGADAFAACNLDHFAPGCGNSRKRHWD